MDDDKITLDRKTFKSLASETRVAFLKSLEERRKTLSELAKEHSMSVSTVKEHLTNLENAGLIEQKDEGRKWKYYELTKKGKAVLNPAEKKFWVLLGLSGLAVATTLTDAFTGLISQSFGKLSIQSNPPDLLFTGARDVAENIGSNVANVTTTITTQLPPMNTGIDGTFPWFHAIFLVFFAALVILFAWKLKK